MKKLQFLYSDDGAEMLFKAMTLEEAKKKVLIAFKADSTSKDFWDNHIKRLNKNPKKYLKILSDKEVNNIINNFARLSNS